MNISTLITDINKVVQTNWMTDEIAKEFSHGLAERLRSKEEARRELRISQLGPRCPKALWHSIHTPELAHPIPPWAQITYSYGHMVELQAIALAKAAGHEVTGEQDELYADGVKGHRDCVIDGHVVDVKSCGRFGYQKFQSGSIVGDDLFGYLDQLDGYLLASLSDDLVRFKDTGYILAVNKELGHMCLYEHKLRRKSIEERIELFKRIVGRNDPPECTCKTVLHGASGNRKLDVQASYSVFRYCCFPDLRTFLYKEKDSYKPVYLVPPITKMPNVIEINRFGDRIS